MMLFLHFCCYCTHPVLFVEMPLCRYLLFISAQCDRNSILVLLSTPVIFGDCTPAISDGPTPVLFYGSVLVSRMKLVLVGAMVQNRIFRNNCCSSVCI